MSDEQNKRLFSHYTGIINGSHSTGNSVSNELIVSDAKRHLADLVKKNPGLVVEEDYPDENINLPPEKRKPKEKK